jgi:transposase
VHLNVADDRKITSLARYSTSLFEWKRDETAAIASDMREPYRQTLRAHVPDADMKRVFAKFDVFQHVRVAGDHVRRHEQRALMAEADPRLTRTKYACLKNPANFSVVAWREVAALRNSTLQAARAWALKERLRRL